MSEFVTEFVTDRTGVRIVGHQVGRTDGPTIVLVHGFPDTSAVWDPVRDLLADRYRVITYDVRGSGQSGAPGPGSGGYALERLVADLDAVIDVALGGGPGGGSGGATGGGTGKVHLVGHDWGSIQSWEAVTTARVATRIASYTSISAPPLDHVGRWSRDHLRLNPADLRASVRQLLRSWYVYAFHLPFAPMLPVLGGPRAHARLRRAWAAIGARLEGTTANDRWPAPTFAGDLSRGMQLYRTNVRPRLRHPQDRSTTVPVQLIVAEHDRYVTPALLDGLETWTGTMWRREIPYGHWVIRTHPQVIADAVAEVVDHVEGGPASPGLTAGLVVR